LAVSGDVAPCSLVDFDRYFRGESCLHHQDHRPDYDSIHLWNVGQYLPDCMAQHLIRLPCSYSSWKPEISPTLKLLDGKVWAQFVASENPGFSLWRLHGF
jgi:hypothetical protein